MGKRLIEAFFVGFFTELGRAAVFGLVNRLRRPTDDEDEDEDDD